MFLTTEGRNLQKLITRYLEYLRDLYLRKPDQTTVTSTEIGRALELDGQQARLLGHLIYLGHLWSGSASRGDGVWSVGVLREVEDLPRKGDLTPQLEQIVLRDFEIGRPVFVDDRLRSSNRNSPLGLQLVQAEPLDVAVSPFKRRYQVFVSSTYEDLKEERRHVMQALLETKCIPTGMELFPAANEAQWRLIKRVIDDCDYYLVIVAGRYGSIGMDGKSYTEMEYDYAVSSGKSVIGFYHSELDNLVGAKLEKNDARRHQLVAFTEKIKQRMCKPWSTPDGLASAIKSAILNAIELDPKLGWIRAADLPSADAIASLKNSVGQPAKAGSERRFAGGDDSVEVPATIGYFQTDDPSLRYLPWEARKSFAHLFKFTWDGLFLVLAPRLNERKSRRGLKVVLEHHLSKRSEGLIVKSPGKHILNLDCNIDRDVFGRILDTFVAQRVLKAVPPPKGVQTKVPYWEITPKGMQRLAELRAIAARQV